jgi:type II secretory pathway pseudopilin PulG
MNTREANTRKNGQRGFVLATVLVFLVVLSLTAFLAAKLARTNIQVVNNLQNEKEAFSIAEAGVQEALYRMSLGTPNVANNVNGQSFDASLAPAVPDRVPSGTFYGIDYTDAQSTSQVIFTTNAPSTGTNNVVPSLQPTSLQLPYSFGSADTAPVNLSSTANLTIGWDICANGTDPGCSAAGAIRQLPLSSPRYVAKIVSTGRSGAATRKVTAWAVDCIPNQTPGEGSLITIGENCNQGIAMNGNSSITAVGLVQVNAGPATCATAAVTGNNPSSFIHAGDINIVGQGQGHFDPAPNTGGLRMADPYAGLLPPCYTGGPAQCAGSPVIATPCAASSDPQNPGTCVAASNSTLNPGIYYGGIKINGTNVTMSAGTYVIAGGGFSVKTGNTSVSSAPNGVFIYNTQNPDPTGLAKPLGPLGAFDITNGNCNAALAAPVVPRDFAGVVFYQDTSISPQQDIFIQGGTSSGRVLDGLVYAPNANMHVQGNNATTVGGALVVNSLNFNGGSDLTVQSSTTPIPNAQCGGLAYEIIGWQD